MNEHDHSSRSDSMAAGIYYAVSGLLFPVTVVGYGLWVAKAFASRQSGVSVTAQGPLSARWFQHNLGTRQDEASDHLMRVLPGTSPLALRLTLGPMQLAHRASGYVPKAFRYPFEGAIPPKYEASARVPFFDDVVERRTKEVQQFVILGAGFDTRALRLPKDTPVKRFEVDMPETQKVKRDTLERAGIDATGVTFVPADFENEDWFDQLLRAGFDRTKPALFIWEGVIMYLDKEAIESTLKKIAALPKGTAVAFDYFTTEPLESKSLYWKYARAATRAANEPLKFGIDATPPSKERLSELLHGCGLSLVEHQTLGDEDAGERAWGGFAVAAVT
ncbi:MAG: class I SAM-dependent methyltransferase [Polyangiaceae bacterium]|nr:class I SAM-dependent methyltransferase [Polyangiaceae bacterium]